MKKLALFLFLFAAPFALCSQEAIRVDSVDFNSLRDDWIQVEIQLSCMGNPAPEARDSNFVENIKVKVYLAYVHDAAAREYDYYSSEVEIVIMEKGDDNNVYFYLPGLIVERDQLQTTPDFYYVEVSVNGTAQPTQKTAMSSNIRSPEVLSSFTTRAEGQNEHILMPIYLTSGIDRGRVSDLPTFLRRDVRQ